MADLAKGIIPNDWCRYTVPAGLTVVQWIQDFAERIKQLTNISKAAGKGGPSALRQVQVWLGGLFMPEAYITATRQAVAQANQWALEELFLDVEIGEGEINENTYAVRNLRLQGADCVDKRKLALSNKIFTELPITRLIWTR